MIKGDVHYSFVLLLPKSEQLILDELELKRASITTLLFIRELILVNLHIFSEIGCMASGASSSSIALTSLDFFGSEFMTNLSSSYPHTFGSFCGLPSIFAVVGVGLLRVSVYASSRGSHTLSTPIILFSSSVTSPLAPHGISGR